MTIYERFLNIGDECAAEFYKDENRSLFYRKSAALKKYFETLPLAKYDGRPLYPSGRRCEGKILQRDILGCIHFDMNEIKQRDTELFGFVKDNPIPYFSSYVPCDHTVAGNMFTHSMPNYERVCAEGFASYRDRIKNISNTDMREGLLLIIDGLECYIKRCTDYLISQNADEKLISTLRKVPMYPCENIYEAIVCWNFVMYLDTCDNLGCLAKGLVPYYKGEDISDLLDNLYDNLDENGGYSMSLATDGENPLVLQCLKALKGKRRPMTELFVDENTTDEIYNAAIGIIKSGGGQPSIYNRKILLDGLMKRFPEISHKDIEKFCGGGCTESMLAGLSCVGSIDAGINLALIFTKTMSESLCKCKSFNEFYGRFIADVSAVTDEVTEAISKSRVARSETVPHPMRTLLIDDCIDKGLDFYNGGARYSWSIVNFAGLINIIDSLAVIKDFIYDKKIYTPEKMLTLLKENNEAFLNEARNFKYSYGNGSSDTNNLAKAVSKDIFSMLDNKKLHLGLGFLPASIQFLTAASAGLNVGATPDGRHSGAPLCESLGAINGKDRNGPTVMLESVCSLALEKALGIPVVNLTVNPDIDSSVLIGLIKGYIQNGGIQLQLTCTDRKTLLEAYENPEMHKNLIVRVGGYSDYFHRVPRELQKSIIERSIYN